MWEISGLLLLVLAVVIGIAFLGDWLADFNNYSSNDPPRVEHKIQHDDYEDEKAKAVYNAAGKRLKLNMMQMEAFRQMSEAAEKHWKQPHQGSMFDDMDL